MSHSRLPNFRASTREPTANPAIPSAPSHQMSERLENTLPAAALCVDGFVCVGAVASNSPSCSSTLATFSCSATTPTTAAGNSDLNTLPAAALCVDGFVCVGAVASNSPSCSSTLATFSCSATTPTTAAGN